MSANSIFVIQPYRFAGTWVFDDEQRDLKAEPFVMGVPEILDEAVKDIPNAESGFRLLFSAQTFPKYTLKVTWIRQDGVGNWYRMDDGREGWLCPALLRYFETAPKEIYAKVEPLVRRSRNSLPSSH